MTTTAILSVAPVIEESMASDVANAIEALEAFDIEYETTPMGTILEADDVSTIFAAAEAAHGAVDADRVSTVLKIDDKRTSEAPASSKVTRVEDELGRPATSRSGE